MIRLLLIIFFTSIIGKISAQSVLIGKTTGVLPFLEYGLGEDRLGGAKMTNLDTGIIVKVIDSTSAKYHIALSKNHDAYIPKSNFIKDSSIRIKPYYLTGSWLLKGDDKYDYLSITLDEKLPYKSIQLINPSKIVIDIYGATSNTNWITQRTSAKEVKNVYYDQAEDDVFRVTLELNHPQHWGYSIYYEGKKLIVKVKQQPEKLQISKMKIAIDAGHGGSNNGADGITTKIKEKDYTLLMAQQLQKALQKEKATVLMIREKDTTLSMPERIQMLKNEVPDFLISIHLNSSSKDSIKGVSTYYRYIGFRPLTQYILASMKTLGLEDFGNIGSFNFSLNGPTDYPNCLVEVAFLSNKEDEQKILDPKFHKAVAQKIVSGIKNWLKSLKH